MNFFIDYGTGTGNEVVIGTLEKAIEVATEGIRYTRKNVCIYDYEEYKQIGNIAQPVAISNWVDTFPEEDEETEPIATFGDYGYYKPFIIL